MRNYEASEDEIRALFENLEADLYRAVGKMVATWSDLESRLAHILTLLLVKSGRGREGETIYYEVPNLRPRIAMLKAAFFNRSDIGATTRRKWKAIIEAIEAEAPERNSIIHGDFIRGTVRNDDLAVGISPRIFSDMRRNQASPGSTKLGFDTADVERHTERVGHLRDALTALYVELPNSNETVLLEADECLEAWRAAWPP